MDIRCYETPKGEILQVFNLGFGRFGSSRKTKRGKWVDMKHSALPIRNTYKEAQADLDAFAQEHEYNPAMPPEENTAGPEAPTEGEQKPEEGGTTPETDKGIDEEGDASSPPEIILSFDAEQQIHELDRRLEKACSDLIAVKNKKAAANSTFNGQIKEIEEEIEDVLSQIKAVRENDDQAPAQDILQFNKGQEVIPDQAPASDPADEDNNCNACGHCQGAHYDERHQPRKCVVSGCSCIAATLEAESREGANDEAAL